jgi:pyridoxal phosphate enzyme (YggS family)
VDDDLRSRLAAVHARIDRAAEDAGRSPADVTLMLATKTQDAATIRLAVEAHRALGVGRRLLLGENRVQEMVAKGPALADLALAYHLIGPLQSNKVNAALRWADSVDAIESVDLARRVAERRAGYADLDVMVQVNVSGEASKHGIAPDEAVGLATAVAALAGLRLVGFQTIGAMSDDPLVVRTGFAALRAVRDEVVASGTPGTAEALELSMGMTGDLELAVAEGATLVRVGTAVFGARPAA